MVRLKEEVGVSEEEMRDERSMKERRGIVEGKGHEHRPEPRSRAPDHAASQPDPPSVSGHDRANYKTRGSCRRVGLGKSSSFPNPK